MLTAITRKRGIHDELKQLKSDLKLSFRKVKDEFSEHLETINQNTNEIQNNYEFLCELDARIDKLSQRMDEMQMFLERQKQNIAVEDVPKNSLTETEQKVFMALYTSEDSLLGYAELAEKLSMSEIMVRNYIHNLMQKGVPIIRNSDGEKVLLSLDPEFKRLQATGNVLKINETLARQFA
jgi:biotin operon repressor